MEDEAKGTRRTNSLEYRGSERQGELRPTLNTVARAPRRKGRRNGDTGAKKTGEADTPRSCRERKDSITPARRSHQASAWTAHAEQHGALPCDRKRSRGSRAKPTRSHTYRRRVAGPGVAHTHSSEQIRRGRRRSGRPRQGRAPNRGIDVGPRASSSGVGEGKPRMPAASRSSAWPPAEYAPFHGGGGQGGRKGRHGDLLGGGGEPEEEDRCPAAAVRRGRPPPAAAR